MHVRAPDSAPIRGILVAGALLGLLAVSAYGFWSRHLLRQAIWEPAGAERFLIFLAVVSIWSAAFILFRPQWLVPFTCALVAIYTIKAVGILPPVSTAFFLATCFILGRLMLPERASFSGAIPGLLSLLTGMSVIMWLTNLLTHFPVNYPATYLGILGACWLVRPKATASCLRRIASLLRPVHFDRRGDYIMLAVACLPLLAHWLVVLKPEISDDALSMHLVVPAYIASHHLWSFDFRHFVWAAMPMGGVWCYTVPYLLGGEFAARLLNLGLLAAICALLYRCALRWVDRPVAFLLAGLFAATPVVQLVTGSLFIETFYAVLLLGALAALWQYHETKYCPALVVCAFLLASAFGVKLMVLPFALPIMFFLAWDLVPIYRRGDRRWLIACAAVILTFAPLPYLYSWVETGNPAFPYLNSIFRSPYFPQVLSPDPRFSEPLTWRTPFAFTFETHRYWEGQDGSAGFQLFLLFPLVLASLRRQWRFAEWTLAGAAAAGLLAGLAIRPNVRYLYPAFPILTLSLALVFAGASPRLRWALWSACALCLAGNLWFLPSSSWYDKTFCLNPFDSHAAEKYLAAKAPARLLVNQVNQEGGAHNTLFLGTMDIAGLRGDAYSDGWHCYLFMERVEGLKTEVDVFRLFQTLGLRRFIFPNPAGGIPVREAQVRRFLADYTEPEADRGSWRLARLRPEFAGGNSTVPMTTEDGTPAPPGQYDDFDPRIRFLANWSHDPQFAAAANHSLTYSDIPDAAFRFQFQGSAVCWVYTKASNRGIAQVFVDAVPRGEVDLYSPVTVWQARTVFGSPGANRHTLEVRILERKNPKSSGRYVDVDELIVL
jgi:hypothetical protein